MIPLENSTDFFATLGIKELLVLVPLALLLFSPMVRRFFRRWIFVWLPVSKTWKSNLRSEVPLYNKLPARLRGRLERSARVFLKEVRIRGEGGFKVNAQVRAKVAGHACSLMLGRGSGFFNGVKEVKIYPSTLKPATGGLKTKDRKGLPRIIVGLWSSGGTVQLSWDWVSYGADFPFDGHNVVFHEFAHAMDYRYKFSGGMSGRSSWWSILRRWFMSREFKKHQSERGRKDAIISEYGATNAEEYFACASEAFFECPLSLQDKHPSTYKYLKKCYRLDPAAWEK